MSNTAIVLRAILSAAALAMFAAQAAHADDAVTPTDWRAKIGTFRIGLIDNGRLTRVDYAPLATHFKKALGLPVEMFLARNYAELIDAQVSSRVEYAIYSAMAYATAQILCECVEPLVAPVSGDGTVGVKSIMLTASREVRTEDAPARRLAISGTDSILTRYLPEHMVADGSILVDGKRPVLFAYPDTGAAINAFMTGEMDGLVGWAYVKKDDEESIMGGTLDHLEASGGDVASYDLVWTSGLLRYGPHVIRNDLPAQVRDLLLETLGNLSPDEEPIYTLIEPQRAGGFEAVSSGDYQPALLLAEKWKQQPGK